MRASLASFSLNLLLLGIDDALAIIVKNPGNQAVPGLQTGMDYVRLGDSDLIVSKVCMGTMTFGEQNTLEEGVEQLNVAFDEYGINFIDTAGTYVRWKTWKGVDDYYYFVAQLTVSVSEMYPVPTKAETQGRTDQAVAEFLKSRNREDVVLATKVRERERELVRPTCSSIHSQFSLFYFAGLW